MFRFFFLAKSAVLNDQSANLPFSLGRPVGFISTGNQPANSQAWRPYRFAAYAEQATKLHPSKRVPGALQPLSKTFPETLNPKPKTLNPKPQSPAPPVPPPLRENIAPVAPKPIDASRSTDNQKYCPSAMRIEVWGLIQFTGVQVIRNVSG